MTPEDFEHVFANPTDKGKSDSSGRPVVWGYTEDGRFIIAVYHRLGSKATLHVVEGADHSFAVLKRSGRNEAEVMDELADTTAGWCRSLLSPL